MIKKYNLTNIVAIVLNLTIMLAAVGCYYWFKNRAGLGVEDSDSSLIVGTAGGYAPFVSMGLDGQYEGFDIEVARVLAGQMGKKLILRDLGSMAALLTALNQGKIDLIMWGMSITQKRLQKLAMVHYEGEAVKTYPLLFWEKIPSDVNTLSDLTGKTVCVEQSSAQDSLLDNYNQITKLPVEKVDDALLNIQYGKAIAALVEPAIAKKFKAKYPQVQVLQISLPLENQEQGVGIVIKPENKLLIKQIQVAVQQLKTAGVIAQLAQKWGMDL